MAVLTLKGSEIKTFPEILRDFASYTVVIKGNSEKTACEYLLDLRTFFRYLKVRGQTDDLTRVDFEQISIKDLTLADCAAVQSDDIIRYMMFIGTDFGNKNNARLRKMSSLRAFYHYLYTKKHLIDHDPTDGVDSPKKGKSLPKYLTEAEAVHLLEAVRSDTESQTQTRDFAMIALFLNTGIRLAELVGLDLTSFDRDLSRMKVKGKGNKERVVYLNDMSRRALEDYLRVRLDPEYVHTSDNAFFLSGRETRISPKTVQWVVQKYLHLAGLGGRGLSVHKLRHTAATLMYQSGEVDIRVLKDILGHEQLNTTQIYTHLVDENMQEAMNKNPLSNLHIKKNQ